MVVVSAETTEICNVLSGNNRHVHLDFTQPISILPSTLMNSLLQPIFLFSEEKHSIHMHSLGV